MSTIVWIDHCDMIMQALRANILPFFSTYHVKSWVFLYILCCMVILMVLICIVFGFTLLCIFCNWNRSCNNCKHRILGHG